MSYSQTILHKYQNCPDRSRHTLHIAEYLSQQASGGHESQLGRTVSLRARFTGLLAAGPDKQGKVELKPSASPAQIEPIKPVPDFRVPIPSHQVRS